jgi:U1 small nuclear ribonucleoprotein 70kDa
MFEPRLPLEFKPPIPKANEAPKYTGLSSLLQCFETTHPPPIKPFEPPLERKRKQRERLQQIHREKNELLIQEWDPHCVNNTKNNSNNHPITENAYLTIFIGRLSYETTEKKLRRELEIFGPIKQVCIVMDSMTGKSRGYGFIEFENETDMALALKKMEGKKIDGRRVVVDVERGRYVFLNFILFFKFFKIIILVSYIMNIIKLLIYYSYLLIII